MDNKKNMLDTMGKLLTQIEKAKFEFEFYNTLWENNNCQDHSDHCNCCWEHFKKAEDARELLKMLRQQKLDLEEKYIKKSSTNYNNSQLIYGITIGSSEKSSTLPCETLWTRFTKSADFKRCSNVQAYFEKGENGYIHIHAILYREKGWSMSINKLRKRYGVLNGKQHNFFIKRLKGIDIKKWEYYIKKDSNKPWNVKANYFFNNSLSSE